jgi:DNA-directed RNA polymerase subunit RPC12/RpoP
MRCPKCGNNVIIEERSQTTLKYYPPVYENGVNINKDKNTITLYCDCSVCNNKFELKS